MDYSSAAGAPGGWSSYRMLNKQLLAINWFENYYVNYKIQRISYNLNKYGHGV